MLKVLTVLGWENDLNHRCYNSKTVLENEKNPYKLGYEWLFSEIVWREYYSWQHKAHDYQAGFGSHAE